jgi:hypothetical protein
MTTAYVVTSGNYSDYSIHAVLLVAYLADGLGGAGGEACIEEFETDTPVPDKPGWKCRSGVGVEVAWVYRTSVRPGAADWTSEVRRLLNAWGCGGVMEVNVLADDKEHAIKIAADKFREFIANGG